MAKQVTLSDSTYDRTLGCGSFGRVKHAKYKSDGKKYAVKFMTKYEVVKLEQVDHINNVKRVMAQIDLPFIVNTMGYARDAQYIYIVMKCITGGGLFTHLHRGRKFDDTQSKLYGAQIGGAFAHIHSKNIIHRDLKPEDILVMSNGYSKPTDFGFAKILEPGTCTYTLCGTRAQRASLRAPMQRRACSFASVAWDSRRQLGSCAARKLGLHRIAG